MARDFDLVVYGATGFTGGLVAEALQERQDVRWAIAGRSRDKLEQVQQRLRGDPAVIVADSSDPDSLRAMCARTKVVVTTVGPYARYGEPLVEAAIAEGTHTADLTGEPQYVRRLIDRHHDRARDAGVRIVCCCGFDSIPSDLGNLVLQQQGPFRKVESVVWASKGGFSGGTAQSMLQLMEEASDPAIRRVLADPYSLDPGGEGAGDTREQLGVRYSEIAHTWTAPWIMASINEKVVRRSNALLGYPWGRDFSFHEVLRTRNPVSAAAITAGLGGAMAALSTGLGRRIAKRVLPSSGEGPSREAIEQGYFELRLFGSDGAIVRVRGDRDPGYGATAKMLSESGICLALDDLDAAGILTPAAAMGTKLVDRLQERGITFEPSA